MGLREDRLSACFAALSNPARRAILERLALGDATVSEIARPLRMSLPAISRHIRVLEQAGLLERVAGRGTARCRLRRQGLRPGDVWVHRQLEGWDARLAGLGRHLAEGRR